MDTKPEILSSLKPTSEPLLELSPCPFLSAHDGDTFRVQAPLGGLWPEITNAVLDIRVAHVNAAELNTDLGKAAHDKVTAWLLVHTPLRLFIYGREKYGRVLADAQIATGTDPTLLSQYVLSLDGTRPLDARRQLALSL
jgi:endonuclease YncB( thermonuclease family)